MKSLKYSSTIQIYFLIIGFFIYSCDFSGNNDQVRINSSENRMKYLLTLIEKEAFSFDSISTINHKSYDTNDNLIPIVELTKLAENNNNYKALALFFNAYNTYRYDFFLDLQNNKLVYPVINQILIDLKKASDLLNYKEEVLGDFIYNGDICSWKKCINSCRLKFIMDFYNLTVYDKYELIHSFNEIVKHENLMEDIDDNMQSGNSYNISYSNGNDGDEVELIYGSRISVPDMLAQVEDPRLFIITSSFPAGTIKTLMSYQELQFILAEASVLGWFKGDDAETYFENGIAASFEYCSSDAFKNNDGFVYDAFLNDYLIHPQVDFSLAVNETQKLNLIRTQRFIASFFLNLSDFCSPDQNLQISQ